MTTIDSQALLQAKAEGVQMERRRQTAMRAVIDAKRRHRPRAEIDRLWSEMCAAEMSVAEVVFAADLSLLAKVEERARAFAPLQIDIVDLSDTDGAPRGKWLRVVFHVDGRQWCVEVECQLLERLGPDAGAGEVLHAIELGAREARL